MKQNYHSTNLHPLSSVLPAALRKRLPLKVFLLLALLLPGIQDSDAWGAAYHGQVVDAETGKPIEGAVALVEWHKKPRIAMGGIAYFHNARETLTDAGGKFSMDSSPGIDWNPFTYIREPQFVVFYPGYRPFTAADYMDLGIKGRENEMAQAFERGVGLKLRKLTSEKDAKRFTDRTAFGLIWSPYEMTPNFYRLINVQRRSVGFEEFIYR